MSQEEILSINFKVLGQPNIETLELPSSSTGETLKTLISDFSDIPVQEMRLIYKGRAIGNADSLAAFGIPDGATINVVKMRKPVQQTPPNPAPAPAPAAAPESNTEGTPNPTQGQPQRPIPRVLIHRTERVRQTNEPHEYVDAEEVKEMRKKTSNLQLKTAQINCAIQKLMAALSENLPEKITENINSVKAIIETSMPEMQEIARTISFSTVHQPEAQSTNTEQASSTESIHEETSETQSSQPAPDPDVEQIPKQEDPKTAISVPDPAEDPDIEPVPKQAPTSAPIPAPAPAAAPQTQQIPAAQPPNPLGGLGGMMASLFQPPPQQAQAAPTAPQPSCFTPEDLAMMDNDAAKVEEEGYIKQLHESYRCTNLYRKMK